ncbi:helix-turn-helix domain-containing protein [Runella zeae]|uniref:helix-turn-helix domain-containing protein n=1 Tax=Runella zeae TaxID=94255 RepID=UPI00235801E3|nr:helix-turn-helix transcriptional regulator [Runella zeae]
MKEIHIGLAIKKLAEKRKVSAEYIAESLKIDRQSVYGTYKRQNVSPKTIEKYAQAIGVSIDDVMFEAGISKSESLQKITSLDENYLLRRLADLEAREQFLMKQITEKDNVIRVLLGKSDSVFLAGFVPLFFLVFGYKFGYTY